MLPPFSRNKPSFKKKEKKIKKIQNTYPVNPNFFVTEEWLTLIRLLNLQ